jgi:threonine dehydratase
MSSDESQSLALWQAFLETLGYRYCNESENSAYKLFLGSSD